MIDAHVHIGFMSNGEEVARDADINNVRLLSATVTPEEFLAARERFSPFGNVVVGLGLHPWWVKRESDADALVELLGEATFVSEVGLDFGKRHLHTRDAQLGAFAKIAHACAEKGDVTLSVHAVHAAREVLDILEESDVLRSCTCIFHWFSGPSDQLKRAIDAGCFFSVGNRMLATGKGREYVKAMPANRLLLETDAPPIQGQAYSFDELRASLAQASNEVASLRKGTWKGVEYDLLPDNLWYRGGWR